MSRRRNALPRATAVALLSVVMVGCGTPDPERAAREKENVQRTERAAARLYKRPYETIWTALLASAAERKLNVVEADAKTGVLELRHGVSATSVGERIDIRVSRTVDAAVRVEIRSRPLLSLSSPPDWQRLLFGDLEQKVAPRRDP
ncbi:MAG: hypothetical protein H7125_17555 [Proteobacteria bacterium]|nr:hypothetical protein [Burkholderiales bacterium]